MEALDGLAAALRAGDELDAAGAVLPASALVELLAAGPLPGAPALRLRGATVTGALRLSGARVHVPVELRDCRFSGEVDLRMAQLSGLALTGSRLPRLRAGNLRVAADLMLDDGFTADGPVDLTDAHIGGSLRLSGGNLRGAGGRALVADRVVVAGTCYARRLHSDGELRLPGARITGNLDLAGAVLSGPTGDVLDITGIDVGGSLLAHRHPTRTDMTFTATGRVLLAGARIGGDLSLSGAQIASRARPARGEEAAEGSRAPVLPAGIVDDAACLVADRVRVEGNLELDDGLHTTGTVRLPNAVVGGYVRLSGARLDGPLGASDAGIALLADGMEVGGDIEGRAGGRGALACSGQVRLIDAHVRGTASLSGITLAAPDGYALLGDRLRVGGELYLRRAQVTGTLRLQNADIGSTLDCEGAQLSRPRLRPDGSMRPSLDLRAAVIGKDLLGTGGFAAAGGVRLRVAEVGKSTQFVAARLGTAPDVSRYALNAYGLTTADLVVAPADPPGGCVRLEQATVGSFTDTAQLWDAAGGAVVDGFRYEVLVDLPPVDLRSRLRWLEQVIPDYAPGPYDQLAAAYRRAGHEDRAERVLVERQRRHYAEAGPAGRIWGWLQRFTVGFGYRPWLAVCWLALAWVAGGTWFSGHVPVPVDDGQHPVFNPWIFAADTLLPIVNLGQDGYWRLAGASQWVATGLVIVGWILATTAAAGAARVLKRVRRSTRSSRPPLNCCDGGFPGRVSPVVRVNRPPGRRRDVNTVLHLGTPLWDRLDAGRHALDEDAELTPIFSALTRGGWRQQQRVDSAVEQFRRDPLTAPIPVVREIASATSWAGGLSWSEGSGSGRSRRSGRAARSGGRHHRVA